MFDFSQYLPRRKAVFAYVCPTCGQKHYPAPIVCSNCGARRDPSGVKVPPWGVEEIKGECKLLTWTRLTALPIGFDARYMVFGIVEFSDGLRASGVVLLESPRSGMTLYARPDVIRTNRGVEEIGLVFEEKEAARRTA